MKDAQTGRGRFVKGDPRIQPGPGRPALTPEQRLQRRVQARVVQDVATEMRAHADAAIEALRDVIEKGDEQAVIGASKLILSYAFGAPSQQIDQRVTLSGADHLTPEMLRRAALQVAARHAEDAVLT